jgi:hypothetical protein
VRVDPQGRRRIGVPELRRDVSQISSGRQWVLSGYARNALTSICCEPEYSSGLKTPVPFP